MMTEEMMKHMPNMMSNAGHAMSTPLAKAIELRQQAAPKHIFKGVMLPEDRFDLTLCNPPLDRKSVV